MTFEETTRANDSPTRTPIAIVLLAIAAILGIVAIFFLPFAARAARRCFWRSSRSRSASQHRALGLWSRRRSRSAC